ncbi:unnamed protein product [Heligmosomoides polygyrus]|uniref:Potassium voltage-gated channel subfamily H member 2 n=1 Tax=Heligmosomoides polygyrus TaxID=6339 RepID=A0A3P7YQQ8_HELPZ|nr:unnamed protein product [Heligmosomoides polygyrus]
MTSLEDPSGRGAAAGAVDGAGGGGGGGGGLPAGVRPRPQLPPKPPIDTIRYSMNNIKESADWQLDALLEELSALETQLNSSSGGDQLLLGIPSLPSGSSGVVAEKKTIVPAHSKDDVRVTTLSATCAPSSCSSPDGDSAFGDASSTESARCRNSAFSSNDSCRDSLHTPSPTQLMTVKLRLRQYAHQDLVDDVPKGGSALPGGVVNHTHRVRTGCAAYPGYS